MNRASVTNRGGRQEQGGRRAGQKGGGEVVCVSIEPVIEPRRGGVRAAQKGEIKLHHLN